MAKEKIVKRIVVHPKLYMAVEGKLQHVKVGTELKLSASQAERLGAKLIDPAEQKRLDTTVKGGKIVEGSPAETEALAQMGAQLEALQKENAALKKAANKK